MANNTGMWLLFEGTDFSNFSEISEKFDHTLDILGEFINCKTDILIQKKERHQQILDNQIMKLDQERQDLIKKSEIVMNKMSQAKSQLMQIEHSYFDAKNKLSWEKQRNKSLQEKIKQLKLESEQKQMKFYKTAELYTTVVSWYRDYLNVSIKLENSTAVSVTLNESKKDFKGYPYVKLEILDGNKFMIAKMHPSMEEDNNMVKQVVQGHEVILFLNKFRQFFLSS